MRGLRRTIGDLEAEQGRYEQAVESYQAELQLGKDALCLERLGDALLHLGRSAEAIVPLSEVTALNPRAHGAAVLLGKALIDVGRLDEATALLQSTLEQQPPTQTAAQAHYALGTIYRRQGDREKTAEHLEAFQRLRKQFAPSGTPKAAEDPGGFEPIYRRAVRLREASLGPTDPRTAQSRLALAYYLAEHGRRAEAEKLLERAYGDLSASAEADPATIAEALERWAELRLDQGDGAGAEALLRKALPLRRDGDPVAANALDRLASLRGLQGDLDGAEALYRQALEAERSGERLRSLAAVMEAQGDAPQAERLYTEALEAQTTEAAGALDPQMALTLNSLGLLAFQRNDLAAAVSHFEQALAIFEQTLGPRTPEAATALDNLGNAQRAAGAFEEAEKHLQAALAIRQQALPQHHPDTAATLNNLAGLYHVQGRLDKAEPLYRSSITSRREAFGAADPVAAETLYNLGYLLYQTARTDDSRKAFEESLTILEEAYGPADSFVGEVRKALGAITSAGSNESPAP